MPTHSKQEADDKQKSDPTKVCLGEFKNFIVIPYRNMDEGLIYKHIRAIICHFSIAISSAASLYKSMLTGQETGD